MSALTPEQVARQAIDEALLAAGWQVQDEEDMNLGAGLGVAVREFPMATGHGRADYLLFVDGRPVGALEAKKEGHTLTGVETRFTNRLDPHPRSRRVFAPHRPETMAEWLGAEPLEQWAEPWRQVANDEIAESRAVYDARPSSLRGRLRAMPAAEMPDLWPNQKRAVQNLEAALADDRPRSLLQMATGSGKSRAAVAAIYRLIKFGGVRRVLFLVDRSNLGKQAEDEFATYRSYDDHRKFTELYNVQRLVGNKIGSSSKVVITTIQRLYSMLRGEAELDPELEEASGFEGEDPGPLERVVYSPAIPPEYFDLIFIDECHRSIYTLWRQVLEYFDAYLVGLTATPAKHTFGFFHRNLVMEYHHEDAVADGVNVDFDIYRIRTRITAAGSKIDADADRITLNATIRNSRPNDDLAELKP